MATITLVNYLLFGPELWKSVVRPWEKLDQAIISGRERFFMGEIANITEYSGINLSIGVLELILQFVKLWNDGLVSVFFCGILPLTFWFAAKGFEEMLDDVSLASKSSQRRMTELQQLIIEKYYEFSDLSSVINTTWANLILLWILKATIHMIVRLNEAINSKGPLVAYVVVGLTVLTTALVLMAEGSRVNERFKEWLCSRYAREIVFTDKNELERIERSLDVAPVAIGSIGYFRISYGFVAQSSSGVSPLYPRDPPCFGLHPVGFFRLVAVVNCLINMIAWVLLFVDVYTNLNFPNDARRSCGEEIYYLHMIVWAWSLFHQCVISTLDILLLVKAKTMKTGFIKGYIIYTVAAFPLLVVMIIKIAMCKALNTRVRHETRWLIPGYFVYKIYLCLALHRYKKDIQWEKDLKSGRRDLFYHEIYQFEEGMEASTGVERSSPNLTCEEKALLGKYNKEEFEIEKAALNFAEAITIGCGEFGCVYKVTMKTRKKLDNEKDENKEVAVKTIDSELNDATCFKALLAEAKVMTFLGKHENIVELIGLCTKEIRKRKLYIILELCAFGNLQVYLKSERANFLQDPESNIENKVEVGPLTNLHLMRWCLEIAGGMEFLASQKSPLPWRWLAVESLVDMKFSTSSDIWSYGVCCWEIFELGKRPWPNYPQFTLDFINDIKNGIRLEKPDYCSQDFFDKIMSGCWEAEPSSRPRFSQIVDVLSNWKNSK
ncbi:unnamed protein product [Orchesella dallaii]|uniref:Protein kinase domain-containing protein n=1 Tax=Orchesella dallaii TaxID=48710 RepID=A0ABP1RVU4_9HEXA